MHSMVSQYVPPRGCVKCGDCAKMFMPESHTKELDELKPAMDWEEILERAEHVMASIEHEKQDIDEECWNALREGKLLGCVSPCVSRRDSAVSYTGGLVYRLSNAHSAGSPHKNVHHSPHHAK